MAAGLLDGYTFHHSDDGRTECGFYVRDGSAFAGGKLWPRAKLPWDSFGKVAVYECKLGVVVNVHLPTPTIKAVAQGWAGAPPVPAVSDSFRGWELREELDKRLNELVRGLGDRLLAVVGDFNVTRTANDAVKPISGPKYRCVSSSPHPQLMPDPRNPHLILTSSGKLQDASKDSSATMG